jgi:MtrB/PioB family decaheme-associated outer membrane protein
MRRLKTTTLLMLLSLLLVPILTSAQDKPPEKGSVEFGIRRVWGDVYGRPDLPFTPDINTSKFNEYSDRRSGMFIRRLDVHFDDILGSKNYVSLKSQSSFYKNQSYLATFGSYGKFKVQFRYTEIPHIYSNTARSIFTQTSPGVLTVPLALKTALQTASSTGTAAAIALSLPNFIQTQAVCGPAVPPATQPVACNEQFITPQILRKAGTGTVSYYLTPNWKISGMFSRENQVGSRPLSLIFNSSPSASASGQPTGVTGRQSPGTGVEVPEPIDYFVNTLNIMSELGRNHWGIQAGYTGSFFENNISTLIFDNPFATADLAVQVIAPGTSGCPAGTATCNIGAVPAHGQVDLYPDNSAHYLNFAGMVGLGKYFTVLGTVNPGWLRQNDPFLPPTANTAITGIAPFSVSSLDAKKQTLAMNWTLVGDFAKGLQVAAKYRHYDYNNNTPELTLTAVQGDTIGATAAGQSAPGTSSNLPFGYNKKTLELTGNWFFTKRSSVKVGYEGEWFNRKHRDVAESTEHSFIASADISPWKELLFRAAYRRSNRTPHDYQDELAEFNSVLIPCSDTTTVGFTDVQRCSRRFDEAARIMNRADLTLQYDIDKFSFTGGFQTIQSDFNHAGGVNSTVPLNFLAGATATTNPYYLYGALKDISYIWSFDATYTFSPEVSLFAEYTKETFYKRMISRYRAPTSGTQTILTCNGCDTANNDWESSYNDLFDTYAAGVDLYLAKKIYLSTFYSLSDGKGRIPSRFLGDPTILAPATTNRFLLVGTTAAVPYPQSNTRIHELAVVLKYKINEYVTPKFEYRLQQFDNEDAQTSVMVPYMACISPATGTAVSGCPTRILNSTTSQTPILSPNGATSFYPGFQVGDSSAARFLFLGADQPSYRAHVFSATLEIRF